MIVVGSANMDIVVTTDRAPEAGETVLGTSCALYLGGKGANQAVAARRAGAPVAFAGCLGTDSYGDRIAEALAREGIDLAATRRVALPSGVAFITVERDGQNRIIVVPGANHGFGPNALADLPDRAQVLLVQLEIPVDTVCAVASRVHEADGTVILNASPIAGLDDRIKARLLGLTDILLVNETEAAQLLGVRPADAAGSFAAEAVRRLAEGRRAAVMTLGAAGAIWCGADGAGRIFGHRVDVVDTTACGDAFAGAFAAAIEHGWTIGAAVAVGNAAGALAATRRGAQSSLPSRAAIDALLSTTIRHADGSKTGEPS